jgi:hypothetical protein
MKKIKFNQSLLFFLNLEILKNVSLLFSVTAPDKFV